MSAPPKKKPKLAMEKTPVRWGAPYKHFERTSAPSSRVEPPRSSSQTAIPPVSPSQTGPGPSRPMSGGQQIGLQSVVHSPAPSAPSTAPRSSGPPSSLSLPDIGQFRPNHYPTYERIYRTAADPISLDLGTYPSSRDSSPVPSTYSFSAPNALQEDTPPKPAMHGSPGDRRRMLRWQERKMALEERRKAERLAIQRSARATSPPTVKPGRRPAAATESSSSLPSNPSQGSVAHKGDLQAAHMLTQTDSDSGLDELHPSQSDSAADHSPQIERTPPARRSSHSSDEWLPPDEEDMESGEAGSSESEVDGAGSMQYSEELGDLLDDPIEEEESVAPSDPEPEEDPIAEEEPQNSPDILNEDDHELDHRALDDEEDHEQHLLLVAEDLRGADANGSQLSNASHYSEDLIREVDAREQAENSLLDLGREDLAADASPEHFKQYEKKLLNLQKCFSSYFRDGLSCDNQRIDIVLRVCTEHCQEWIRQHRGRGGGGGAGGGSKKRPRPNLDEDEIQEFRHLIDSAHLTYTQRILRCQNAQELIDDLERNPPIPVLEHENLAEAVLASRKRCEWLSAYFKLIKEKLAFAWLQMRGPLASNLINIWTWKLEFDVAATIEYIEDVNTAFGEDWCLLEILRKVERGEEGSPAERFSTDLYSTKYIQMIDRSTRPRPLYPGATLPRVSAWMTLTRYSNMDTTKHRDLFDSPPTQFFANYALDNMRYGLKWHVKEDLEDWPMLLSSLNEAVLTQLKRELAMKTVPANPFTDEDLADPNGGGRKVSAEEVYDDILQYTKHRLNIHDKKIAAIHWEHKQRRSRRRLVGNIMPNMLLAPPPALDIDYLPDLEACREAKTVYTGAEMCYRCRNRKKIPRQGVHRACYGFEGAGCVECADNSQPCLRRKPDVKIKNISSKDWQPKRPHSTRDDGVNITKIINDSWYNGHASEDTAPPETWDEIDDSLWLDMRAIERAERKKLMEKEKAEKKAEKAAERVREAARRAQVAEEQARWVQERAQGGNAGRKQKRSTNDEDE
ncbi:hypothetical protein CALCODRAFT_527922 [Calocera cornea HHB12733]|uniref:Putative Zn2Cys6 domain-containing protein n=1 Tax=Calocera cornea HHB12733 TaxID=1353952 RepID=A0A165E2Z2_9BASI|nr:hypothetical protein CALCODRAFT_527922 [Calocera cornea HHB12733]